MINPNEIKKLIKTKIIGKKITYYDFIDSTNLEALRLIESSQASQGEIIITKSQSSGKGQQDHKWTSPEGGLYMSIITASKVTQSSNLINFVSGIACVDAIHEITGIKPNLKWVNDIIINQQKLGGILTESITRGQIATNVSGIGINVNTKVENVDNKLKPISLTEITNKNININGLIASICNHFEHYFLIYQQDNSQILSKWLEYSNITGLNINFYINNQQLTGIIENINNLGHLIVNTEGQKYTLTSTKNTEIIYPAK